MDVRAVGSDVEAFYALLEALPAIVWTCRSDGTRVFVNAAWREFTGASIENWTQAIHPDDLSRYQDEWRRATSSGGLTFQSDYRLWHAASGRYRWLTAQAAPHPIAADQWVGTMIDIDDRKRRELAHAFLSRAGLVLNQTLSLNDTLLQLAMLAVGSMCDYCVFYVVDGVTIRRAVWRHRDPSMEPLLDEVIAHGPDPDDPQWLVAQVIRTNAPALWNRGERMSRAYLTNPRYDELVDQLDLKSVLMCPVHVGTTVYGALALARTGDTDFFDRLDTETAMQLADRAALAIANAHVYEREHRVAYSFQSAALPDAISTRDGIEIDAYYRPARSDARVGGDWYDTELLPDGRLLVSIGDVSGSGLEAAVIMSMMRTAIRSVAHVYADPATILEAAHGGTERRLKDHFATVFIGVIDPILGRFTYSNAGHTPPLLLVDDRTIEVHDDGLPIGTIFDLPRKSDTIELPPNSTLVLYTDGLTEGAGPFLPGEDALRAYVSTRAFREHPTAAGLYAKMLPDGGSDDVAILIARISLREAAASAITLPLNIASGQDAAHARDAICDEIVRAGLLEGEALENARLVIGELTANVSRHAPGEAFAAIDRFGSHPVFHLVDRGLGFRYSNRLPPIFAESGRGLFIASALARRLEVLPDLDGGSHVIAVLEN